MRRAGSLSTRSTRDGACTSGSRAPGPMLKGRASRPAALGRLPSVAWTSPSFEVTLVCLSVVESAVWSQAIFGGSKATTTSPA